jgi:hypothetical protein
MAPSVEIILVPELASSAVNAIGIQLTSPTYVDQDEIWTVIGIEASSNVLVIATIVARLFIRDWRGDEVIHSHVR